MSSPNIDFAEIPSTLRVPGKYAEFNLSVAGAALPPNAEKLLLIGQRVKQPSAWVANTAYALGAVVRPTVGNGHYYICSAAGTSHAATEPTWPTAAAGTVTDGTVTWMEYVNAPTVNALVATKIYKESEAVGYAGAGSHIHLMARAAIKANPYIDLTMIALDDDGAAVTATGTIVVAGPATSAGVLSAYIGSQLVTVTIASADSANTIAAALAAAINAYKHLLPVVATVATATVTLRAKNGGTLGNQIPVSASVTATGVTLTVNAMASGATDPDLGVASGCLDTVENSEYTLYVSAYPDASNLGDVKTHLDTISNGTERRPAICVFGYTDKIGNAAAVKTLCGTTLNHWRTTCGYLPNTKSLPCEVGAAYAAVIASVDDPAGSFDNLPLTGINAPAVTLRLTETEKQDFLTNGVTPLHVIPGELVGVVRAITTYIRNASGVLDDTRLDLRVPRSLDYTRKACVARVALRFPRPKKTAAFKKALRSELLDVLYAEEKLEILENIAAWEEYLIIEDDSVDANRVNARIPADIVQGAHVLAMRIDLL